jgi:biotin carboxyl carrier protein
MKMNGLLRRGLAPMLIVAALLVLVPFWVWYGTWFGRPLGDEQMTAYLGERQKLRQVQHALTEIDRRIRAGDRGAERWYPQVVALKDHPVPEIRVEAAWVMGQDNRSESFHQALRQLVADADPMVRRNAALALVRFGDDGGRGELGSMLQPFTIRAPSSGGVTARLRAGDAVVVGSLVARVGGAEVRAPVQGYVSEVLAGTGATVAAGDGLITVGPDKGQVWEALRALYLVGRQEDLSEVERYARGVPGMPDRVREQAALAAEAIKKR